MAGKTMTVRGLQALKPGEALTDADAKGTGVLEGYRRAQGVHFSFRYTNSAGVRERLALGIFDADGKHGGVTLAEASAKAADLRKRYTSGARDLRVALAADDAADKARAETVRIEREQVEAKQSATLGALCAAYAAQLRLRKRTSADKVERALHRHVREPWPALWNRPAADVSALELVEVLARLTHARKLREAAKVRSYLRAAYAAAAKARHSASAVPELRALGLGVNPAAALTPIEGASNARERCLSLAEARAYWRRIAAMQDEAGAVLRFHFLTGGQRAEQLARTLLADFDAENATLRLLDPKGRRDKPRRHIVPLIPEAIVALHAMGEPRLGPHVFTADHGATGCDSAGLRYRVRMVADAMQAAGEAAEPFTFGDLRRTIATRLQELGVSMDVRAHLQSHGLGGLLQRHYEKHDYMAEIHAALEKLHRYVAGTGKVVAMPRARA
ncbi:MAG: site-specific integrase [Vulcanimicrobiaceae bacterium]